ncbi:hypothetical protein [Mycolicibacterium arenosum]|uniref:Integral membrane protein n=1 Tax=Mycolicibacterium arenosum TaxID=2952157 RepID=A0ABT1M3A4_9MYCO|nr:hypothetical protein [Mycolicibacterium sp. CAU 1645]MCP9273277.1 hypothetical protein [Mycolicibacterium sp. CAU 1645]
MSVYRWAGLAFGVLALAAGGLQVWAFVASGFGRHLVVGVFALAVGGSVVTASLLGRRP